jgi:UMF1 family MFS transporter
MTRVERSWVLYDWANSAYSITVTAAVFPIFFKTTAASGMEGYQSTALWGYANSLATVVIAVLAPILGTIADYPDRKKRFFLAFLILGVCATASFVLIQERQWVRALVLYLFSALGFAGANVFYDALLVDVTTREKMDWVSASGFAYGYIGSTIPFMLGMAVIIGYRRMGLPNPASGVKLAFLITAVWWALFSIPLVRNVHQLHAIPPSETPIADSFRRIADTFRHIRRYRSAFVFLVAYFFYIDGVDTIIKMAAAVGTDIGIGANMLLAILLATQIVAFPFALLYGRLAGRFSARRMLFVGIAAYCLIVLIAFLLPALPSAGTRVVMFWVLAMLVATSQGGIQALSRSLFGKLIPADRAAEFFGFYNIFGKFAAIMGPFMVGFFSQVTGRTNGGVLSLLVLFLVGGALLARVPAARAPAR